jgi:hypothetical protein
VPIVAVNFIFVYLIALLSAFVYFIQTFSE